MAYTLVPTELIVDGAITSAKLDTNIAISGTLGVTGEVTLATHLIMGDNDKIKIGTGGDLEIYHDGSNSYISNSTGNIYLGDTNGAVHIQAKLNEESIVAVADGAVTLYHDNSAKLATASGGVTVTGALSITGDGSNAVTFTESGAGLMTIASADDFVIDSGSDIIFDADGADIRYKDAGTEFFRINNGTTGPVLLSPVSDKDLIFKGNDGGSEFVALNLDMSDAGRATFNNKASFNNAIAVGQSTFTGGNTLVDIHGSGSGVGANIAFANDHNTDKFFVGIAGDTSGDVLIYNAETSNMIFGNNNAEKMRIDSSGKVHINETVGRAQLNLSLGNVTGVGQFASSQINLNNPTNVNAISQITFGYDAVGLTNAAAYMGYLAVNQSNYGKGALVFGTRDVVTDTQPTERMRIASDGNIGFNTSDVTVGSSVSGSSTATPKFITYNNDYSSGYTDASLKLYLFNSGSTRQGFTSGPAFDLQYHSSGSDAGRHAFYVANTESMRINKTSVNIVGSLSKGSGSFKIDHPLESKKDTHHLVHSFVEAPQADNIYRGVVQLENGTATINLDTVSGMTEGTFAALNTNTLCFTSNETDWDSVKGSVTGNILTINCQITSSTARVSWLVIGERQDQHMKDANWTDENGKIIVEPLREETYKLDLEG